MAIDRTGKRASGVRKSPQKSRAVKTTVLDGKRGAVMKRIPYSKLRTKKGRPGIHPGSPPTWTGGNVLGFFIVGFLLERPAGGGAANIKIPVDVPPGTKQFYPWMMHHEYHFLDPKTGQAIERPLWIQFTDLYAYRRGSAWYLEVTGGWADKGDTTHWEGFIGVIGIATS